MVERVNNEIAMAPPVPAQVLEENRRRVLGAMKDLVREGWIELKKG